MGALGTVCKGFEKYPEKASHTAKFDIIQKTALLGTTHIIRNFLSESGNEIN